MKNFLVICGLVLTVSCIKKSTDSQNKDVFLQDVLKSKHQVVYLEGSEVFWVACKADSVDEKYPAVSLDRTKCNHQNKASNESFASQNFETKFQPRLRQAVGLTDTATSLADIDSELTYKKRKLDEARALIVENAKAQVGGASAETGADAQLVNELTARIEVLEAEKIKFVDFDEIVSGLKAGKTLDLFQDERRAKIIVSTFQN